MDQRYTLRVGASDSIDSAQFADAIGRHYCADGRRIGKGLRLGVFPPRESGQGSSRIAIRSVASAELVRVADPFEAGGGDVVETSEEEVAGDAVDGFAVEFRQALEDVAG